MRNTFGFRVWFGLLTVIVLVMGVAGLARAAAPVAVTAGDGSKHAVALTFDDGPSPQYTPEILSLLKQYQAKATFFVLGCKVEQYPAVVKTELREGHELGNHSYSHPRLLKTGLPARQRQRPVKGQERFHHRFS
jgi:peptidoglycan/xylan/chitin deacetylase (PgdA/CDA1 family)